MKIIVIGSPAIGLPLLRRHMVCLRLRYPLSTDSN